MQDAGAAIGLVGIVTLLVGLVSVLMPLRFLRIRSRGRGALIAFLGLVVMIAGTAMVGEAPPRVPVPAPPALPTPAPATPVAPAAPATPVARAAAPSLPSDEVAFIQAVREGRAAYDAAANDFAKGGTRAQRKAALCAALKGGRGQVWGWLGHITELSSNSDGKGVIKVQLDRELVLATWNNSLSDLEDHTLIEPASPLFAAVAALKEGDSVIVAGRFLPSAVDCVKEQSITLSGSMEDPAFVFRFSTVSRP